MVRLTATLAPVIAAAWMVSASPASAASFDCTKAAHPLENTICASPVLSKKDEEMARAYRARLALILDKQGLREEQREWQRLMRQKCSTACPVAAVSDRYDRRLARLTDPAEDEYQANYKTNDALDLSMTHWEAAPGDAVRKKAGFQFSMRRYFLDAADTDKPLCLLDAPEGGEPPFAEWSNPKQAHWSDGKGCQISFSAMRQADGHVPSMDVVATDGCRRYCADKRYGLSDQNLSPNNPHMTDPD